MRHQPEPVDRIPGDEAATRWRRAARRHQHAWREAHGWPAGTQARRPGQGGVRPIGTRVDHDVAVAEGCNFLTAEAVAAVRHRLDPANRQRHETLDEVRLWGDLLSSVPLCFNLFGPLWADPVLAAAALERWFPRLHRGTPVRVQFEWSPGRRDAAWLGDGTAFGATLVAGDGAGGALVGIETKYHEYPTRPHRRRPMPVRYLEVADAAGLFADPETAARVWGTPLEQLWREHLLALAAAQHPQGWGTVHYVLTAPSAHPAWERLADEYLGLLTPAAASTFEYLTLDQLVRDAADLLPHAELFRARYLDVRL